MSEHFQQIIILTMNLTWLVGKLLLLETDIFQLTSQLPIILRTSHTGDKYFGTVIQSQRFH